ncbi:MAG: hypothetical protein GF411_18130 [Candidatus Lokiarchaeota archaeon]|nr:hypothetical protein [Candidatus Lokiarchaeota archaeon]
MIIRMEKEEEKTDPEEVKKVRGKAAEALLEYLGTYRPEKPLTDSKHSLMGPVGKLLTRVTTTGEVNWDAVKGYVLNLHKNQQAPRGVSAEAIERLDDAIAELAKLKDILPPTKWLKMIEDLDDEVFFGAFRDKLYGQRKHVTEKFQEWLKNKYTDISEINELIDEQEYTSFEDMDPFSTPDDLEDVIDEFWKHYKAEKKKKKEGK